MRTVQRIGLALLAGLLLLTQAPAADITVTEASVVAGANAKILYQETFGETVTKGQACYKKAADSRWYKGDADAATPANVINGIALTGGAAGQPAVIQTDGQIAIGGTVVVGKVYVLSATAGGIAPVTDLTTGWTTNLVGVGVSATTIQLYIHNSGVAVP